MKTLPAFVLGTLLLTTTVTTFGFAENNTKAAAKAPAAETTSPQGFVTISVPEFEKLRANTNNVVLDVRTKGEFDKGHIPGAVNIDVRSADFEKQVAKLDKSKTYLVHCAAGGRSVTACNKLAPLKFEKLFNLKGGYGEWMFTSGKAPAQ